LAGGEERFRGVNGRFPHIHLANDDRKRMLGGAIMRGEHLLAPLRRRRTMNTNWRGAAGSGRWRPPRKRGRRRRVRGMMLVLRGRGKRGSCRGMQEWMRVRRVVVVVMRWGWVEHKPRRRMWRVRVVRGEMWMRGEVMLGGIGGSTEH
jgi:hypothetical protein